jgi:SAM-dependent methyltransferase
VTSVPAAPDPDIALVEELSARVIDGATPIAHPDRQAFLGFLEQVSEHADVASPPVAPGPRGIVRKALLRALRVSSVKQTAHNQAVLAAIQSLDTEMRATQAENERRIAALQALAATTESAIDQVGDALRNVQPFLDALAADASAMRGLVSAIEADNAAVRAGHGAHEEALRGLAAARDEATQRLADAEASLGELTVRLGIALDRLAGAERTAEQARAGLARERARVDLLLTEVRRPEHKGDVTDEAMAQLEAARASRVYAQLEDRFRGSPEELVRRFERGYAAELVELAATGAPVADIGCGTGEWLSVLQRRGIPGWGIDLSPEAVDRARSRGFDARLGDGLAALAATEPGSLGAVTSFQVIEHLGFDDLVVLVEAALVALRPGGLVILETPNPLNLAVAATSFHLDPSHVRPVPPQLADFVLTSVGFVDVETRFLNAGLGPTLPDLGAETTATAAALVKRINETFFGPPDYAVVGRKP